MKLAKLCLAVSIMLLLAGCQGADVSEDADINGTEMEDSQNAAAAAAKTKEAQEEEAGNRKAVQTGTAFDIQVRSGQVLKEIKMEGWRIQDGCTEITEAMAEGIYQKVLKLVRELKDGIEAIENSRMVFLREETKGDTVTVRAVFEADHTSVRSPKDHPLIQGMYEAASELESEEEKQEAKAYIQGHLLEMQPQSQVTCRVPMEVVVEFEKGHTQSYGLYYPYVENSREYLQPLRQYAMAHWKENAAECREMGRKMLLENVRP